MKVNYICALETNGKLTPEAACKQIDELWRTLQQFQPQVSMSQFLPQSDGEFN